MKDEQKAIMTPVHELKCWPEFYDDVESGRKPFEMRKCDRNYGVCHILHIKEWNPNSQSYTGRECRKAVTYILSHNLFSAVPEDFVIMGLIPEQKETPKEVTAEEVMNKTFFAKYPIYSLNETALRENILLAMEAYAQPLREEIERMKGCLYERGQTIKELDAKIEGQMVDAEGQETQKEFWVIEQVVEDRLQAKYWIGAHLFRDGEQHSEIWTEDILSAEKFESERAAEDELSLIGLHGVVTEHYILPSPSLVESKQHQDWPGVMEFTDWAARNDLRNCSGMNAAFQVFDWLKDWKGNK